MVPAPHASPQAWRSANSSGGWSATTANNSTFDWADSYDGDSYLRDSDRSYNVAISESTTPANSQPTTPGTSLLQDTTLLLQAWATSAFPEGSTLRFNDVEVAAGLDALARAADTTSWPETYDTLLTCLACHGGRAPHAKLLRVFVNAEVGERIARLRDAMRTGVLTADAAPVVELVGKLKLCAMDKQDLAEVRAALDTTRLTLQRTQRIVPDAPAPALLAPGPSAPCAVHVVRKEPLHLGPEQPEPLFCGPISIIRDVGAEAAVQGAALALMGRTFAKGSFAKIKPVVLLDGVVNGGGEVDAPKWQRYVVRVERAAGARDFSKENLRGPGWSKTTVSPLRRRLHEREALHVARSEVSPHLRWVDGKRNAYQLIPYLDGDVCQAIQRNPELGKNPALLHAIFDAVLPRLVRLHANNQQHFDIKPDNLLLNVEQGRVVLADFGHAGPLRPERAVQRGTPRYHAPEMALGDGYGLTTAADLYCFAVTVACIVDHPALARTPLYRLSSRELALQRPELFAEARRQLLACGAHVVDTTVAHRANLLALREASTAYDDWYEDRAAELSSATEVDRVRWGDTDFDALIRSIACVDFAAARLVARGLHGDPRVRGDAATWVEQMRLHGRAPSATQCVALRSQLLADGANDPQVQRAEAAFAELKRAAERGNLNLAADARPA